MPTCLTSFLWRRPIAKLMPVLFNTRLAEPEPGGIGVNCIGNVLRHLFFHKPTAMAEIIETGALATLHELEKRNIVSCTQAQTQQMQDYSDTSDTDAEAVHGQPDVRLGKELGVDHADGGASVFISNPGHTSHTNDFSDWDMDIDVNFDVPMQQADLDVDIGVCNEQLSKEMMPCTKKRKKTKSTINADIDVGTCWENWQISADGMRQIEFARRVDMPQKVSVGRFSLPLAPAVFSVATTYEFILHLESEGWTWQKLKPFKGQSRPAYRIGDAASPKTWMTAGISVSTEYLHCLSEAQQLKNKFGIDAIPHGLPAKQYEQALKGIHFDNSLRRAHVRLGMKAHRRRSGRGFSSTNTHNIEDDSLEVDMGAGECNADENTAGLDTCSGVGCNGRKSKAKARAKHKEASNPAGNAKKTSKEHQRRSCSRSGSPRQRHRQRGRGSARGAGRGRSRGKTKGRGSNKCKPRKPTNISAQPSQFKQHEPENEPEHMHMPTAVNDDARTPEPEH